MTLSQMSNFCNECDYAPSLCGCDVSECIKRGKPPTEDNEYERKETEMVHYESDAIHKYGL